MRKLNEKQKKRFFCLEKNIPRYWLGMALATLATPWLRQWVYNATAATTYCHYKMAAAATVVVRISHLMHSDNMNTYCVFTS